jgi:hypothetical protein
VNLLAEYKQMLMNTQKVDELPWNGTATGVQAAQQFHQFATRLEAGDVPTAAGRKAVKRLDRSLREFDIQSALKQLVALFPPESAWKIAERIEQALAHFEGGQGIRRMQRGDKPANALEEHLRVLLENKTPRSQRWLYELLKN